MRALCSLKLSIFSHTGFPFIQKQKIAEILGIVSFMHLFGCTGQTFLCAYFPVFWPSLLGVMIRCLYESRDPGRIAVYHLDECIISKYANVHFLSKKRRSDATITSSRWDSWIVLLQCDSLKYDQHAL